MAAKNLSKADGIVVVLCLAVLCFTVGAVDQVGKEAAGRRVCQTRLSGLGKAMLLYCNDYDDEFPKAGGRANEWVPTIPNWRAQTRKAAFGLNYNSGKATLTSSLYLLVKYVEVTPKQFVCPSDPETREFKLESVPDELPKDFKLYDAWDFGGRYDASNNPASHCSYAYHMPFNNYALTTTHEPGMAVLADRNPWMNPKRVTDPNLGWEPFINGGADAISNGNSDTHQRQGQNVLFLDSHVAFETRATCGVEKDNIYAIGAKKNSPEMPKTQCPKVYGKARPANRHDSVLVQGI
ncbi:MAG: hypothetical protein HQ515_04115 [Phycisphaeraceae bacterium]|nr:hypothetical protein [Phycisphaeraceae bacterium]